jgi:hypothetical protein
VYNDAKSSTITSYNNVKNKISSVTKQTLVGAKEAAIEGQKWVTTNKSDILKVTEAIQTAGDHMTKAGLALAVGGLVVGPEGAVPGLRLAEAGGYVSGIGTFGEIATETITQDYSTAGEKGLLEIAVKGAGMLGNMMLEKILPGAPNISPQKKEIIKGAHGVVLDELKPSVEKKGKRE